jgi:TonB family protein
MRRRLCALLLAAACWSVGSTAQTGQDLSTELVRQTLVLRNYYTSQKLKYDAGGKLLSNGTPGASATDARVYIQQVRLDKNTLVIRGEHPISVFDPATGDTTLLGLHERVDIEVQLPSDKSPYESAHAALDKIFLTAAEANAITCTEKEEKVFREVMLRLTQFVSAKPLQPPTGGEPLQLCFPAGSRAYVAGNGVSQPEEAKVYPPSYPAGQLGPPTKKLSHLAIIVDESGKPTSLVVVGNTATVFDLAAIQAVRGWKFHPGSYQDHPVPTAITVDVTFQSD